MAKFKIICGLPGSGKTTYIKDNIKKGDLVFDYDEIQAALSFQPKHLTNKGIHPYITEILQNMVKRAKYDKNIDTVWIIRTIPDERFQSLFVNCNVEYFYHATPMRECLSRINDDPERQQSDKNWFSMLMDLEREAMHGAYEICTLIKD